MKVWVLMARATTDVLGELLDSGGVVGVFASNELAEETLSKIPDTYTRNRNEHDIEEHDVIETRKN